MPQSTTLFLGAGASFDYGFPVGKELRRQIVSTNLAELVALDPNSDIGRTRSFLQEFKRSQRYSIDSFLARRPEFNEIGKIAIARVIVAAETQRRDAMFDTHEGDNWYQYLVNMLAIDEWHNFDPSRLSIVTFNYDRSLEYYLINALQATYGRKMSEVVERLQRMRLAHVYGSLGTVWPGPDSLEFGGHSKQSPSWTTTVRSAAARLRVIPEGRDDDPTLEPVRTAVGQAERIGILGFGFDRDNIRRLGAPDIFVRGAQTAPVFATVMGLRTPEVADARAALFTGARYAMNPAITVHPNFRPQSLTCEPFLRETSLLK